MKILKWMALGMKFILVREMTWLFSWLSSLWIIGSKKLSNSYVCITQTYKFCLAGFFVFAAVLTWTHLRLNWNHPRLNWTPPHHLCLLRNGLLWDTPSWEARKCTGGKPQSKGWPRCWMETQVHWKVLLEENVRLMSNEESTFLEEPRKCCLSYSYASSQTSKLQHTTYGVSVACAHRLIVWAERVKRHERKTASRREDTLFAQHFGTYHYLSTWNVPLSTVVNVPLYFFGFLGGGSVGVD